MKSLLFFLVLFAVLGIAWTVSKTKEPFQDATPDGASPGLNIPIISPRYQTLTKGEVMPMAEPSTALLAPPPGQSASVNAQPPEDPALQKCDPRRIQSVYESLTTFFQTDAPGLQKLGDASVQLPMSTAKSDTARLKDELAVLQRNPGMESTLTQDDVNGVEANLGYLQKKWRLSANANSGLSPMPPATEGFSDAPSGATRGWFTSFFGGTQEGFQAGSGSGSDSGSGSGSGSTTTAASGSGITLNDLQDLSLKLSVETVRLEASGTTDANTQSRISVLKAIKQNVDDMIGDIKSGVRNIKDITLTKADIASFLPVISNVNTAIPTIINQWGLSSILNSLIPNYALGDISGAQVARDLIDKYGKDMLTNLSWDIGLSFKGKAEQDIAANNATAMHDMRYVVDTAGTPGASNTDTSTAGLAISSSSGAGSGTAYRGLFDSVISSVTGQSADYVKTGFGTTNDATGEAATSSNTPFDWKARSTQICKQITARGMPAYDFGCMKDPDTMKKESFSWRGYTRTICTRLATNYDPSIPELCGCPPPTWAGWRP